VIGERREVQIQSGSVGAVVTVYAAGLVIKAYEVEFHMIPDVYALATIDADDVTA
jgi:hypothetical protein